MYAQEGPAWLHSNSQPFSLIGAVFLPEFTVTPQTPSFLLILPVRLLSSSGLGCQSLTLSFPTNSKFLFSFPFAFGCVKRALNCVLGHTCDC